MTVEQVHYPDQQLMTHLEAKVDDIWVKYHRVDNAFAYIFRIIDTVPVDRAEAAVREIVSIFEGQSYDHGAEWRLTTFLRLNNDFGHLVFRADFRIRDSY